MSRATSGAVNIGPGEQRKRYALGWALLALSLVLSLVYRAVSLSPWWHLSLFFPLWGSMLGLLQARGRT